MGKQILFPTSTLKNNREVASPRAPPEGGPGLPRQVCGAQAGPTSRASPGPQARHPRRGPDVPRRLAPLPLRPPVREPPPTGAGALQSRPRVVRRWRRRRCGFPASPPLPFPAASARHSRASAYPQLLEIRHFIPPAGAAAAAATAPPPVATNDAAAATTATAAASSTILHWAPLKTPRPLPPPPPPSPPARHVIGAEAPPQVRTAPPTQRSRPPSPPLSARAFRPRSPLPELSSHQLPSFPAACRPPACGLVLPACLLSPAWRLPSRERRPEPDPLKVPSQLQHYRWAWRRPWPGGSGREEVAGPVTVSFRENPYGGCERRKQPQIQRSLE